MAHRRTNLAARRGPAAPTRPQPTRPGFQRLVLAAFVVLLIAAAFARAHYTSTTGIRMVGDGADYEAIAASGSLEGRAPFVYRPAVPWLVGTLFPDNLLLGFVLVCGMAMFAALYGAGALAPDQQAGFGIVAVLFFNYQVLFAAANPARLDIVVLAVQIGFVALLVNRQDGWFLVLFPLTALLKETMLLSLGALALIALAPRVRELWAGAVLSIAGFVGIHLLVRTNAVPTGQMPPYADGVPVVDGAVEMLLGNLSWLTPLDLFVAWGGLCLVVAWMLLVGPDVQRNPWIAAITLLLLLFPLPLATDVHRAWFELLAPLSLFLLLPRLTAARRPWAVPMLALALIAGVVPYAMRFVSGDHLYLVILEQRMTLIDGIGVAGSLAVAAAALRYWAATSDIQPST